MTVLKTPLVLQYEFNQHRAAVHAPRSARRLLCPDGTPPLAAEELRDAILSAAGVLNPASGGPPFQAFRIENKFNTMHYHPEDPDSQEVNRRFIYRMWARGGAQPLLNAFDCSDTSVSTPSRSTTTTPLNALTLLNSQFTFTMAAHLAERLIKEAGDDTVRQVDTLFEVTTGRSPVAEEPAACSALATKHGLASVCRVVLNSNAFLTIEQLLPSHVQVLPPAVFI